MFYEPEISLIVFVLLIFFFFSSSFLAYLYSLPLTSTLDCCPPLSISGKAHRLHL